MQLIKETKIPRIFVINLLRSPDRKIYMRQQLEKYNLKYEFFAAIDGANLSKEMLSWYDDNLRQSTQWFPHALKENEIACVISHLLIYEKMIKENIAEVIIFEDDVTVTDDLYQIIQRQALFPKRYELLYYHHGKAKCYPNFHKVYKNYKIVRYRRQSKYSKRSIIYASAYQLTRTAAIKLITHAYPIVMPIDIFLGHMNIHQVKTYGVEPVCCWQNRERFISTIGYRED